MAQPTEQITAQPNYALEIDQTIVFLRPLNEDAIAVLNDPENVPYRVEIGPRERPSDQQSGYVSDGEGASPGKPKDPWDQLSGDISRDKAAPLGEPDGQLLGESFDVTLQSPLDGTFCKSSCEVVRSSALRLGCGSIEPPSRAGFTFGGNPGCSIMLPFSLRKRDFTIHYNLESGALMVTAKSKVKIGGTVIQKGKSLLLMRNTILDCLIMKFSVEFPDISRCLQAHKDNCKRYSERLDVKDARYMQTSIDPRVSIGKYQSADTLGHGGFGTVHLAVDKHTGAPVAMKMITKESKTSDMREIETMKNLHHVC